MEGCFNMKLTRSEAGLVLNKFQSFFQHKNFLTISEVEERVLTPFKLDLKMIDLEIFLKM